MELDTKAIAEALMIEPKSDLNSAQILLKGGEYSRSIYHSQLAVEKAMKSCLALAGKIITDNHFVSDRFIHTFSTMPNGLKIAKNAKYLERQGTKTRYPMFRDATRPIWTPSKEYTKSDAIEAFGKAESAFDAIIRFLEDQYKITFKLE